jgi:hypothetical protein
MLWFAAPLHAADGQPWGVSLIARDTLDGWIAGPEEPRGWSVKDGVLRGDKGCAPLTGSWTFGDFDLEYEFSSDDGGELVVDAIDATTGKRLTQSKAGGSRASGKLARHGDHARAAIQLTIAGGSGNVTSLRVQEPAGELLFNGRDLTGFWTPGNPKSWKVEDGAIVCLNDHGDYLRSEKQYANFTLSLEYKIAKGGNSGIGIRTPRDGWPSGDGMEMQVEDRPADEPLNGQSPMAIYSNVEPFARADRSGQWNRVVIKAEGRMISAWMNGELVQCVNTAWQPELKHRHLKGWIGFQDHNDHVEYRNIRVLEAPDGMGLAEWYAPRPPFGSQVIVDRLMNPEVLARGDGPKLETLRKTISGAADQVIAELDGPGAVVAIMRSNERGQVRLYFDDESTPRVDCPAADLLNQVPALARDKSPMLVYVPYKKALKITLAEAKKADYAIDYVKLTSDVRIEPFAGLTHTAARGLLTAAAYRLHQQSHGTMRKFDPEPKAVSEPKEIKPGKKETLVSLDGTGVVDWFRLHVSNKALANDDLWIEVAVDGDERPSLAAPVRYLYPGFSQGGNFRNYLETSRDGFACRVAMPFRDGLTMSLENRGKRSIKDVDLTVSYERKETNDPLLRNRLQGLFLQPASATIAQSFRIDRLVGLVCRAPAEQDAKLASLLELPVKGDDLKQALNGRAGSLAWRWWLLGPPQNAAATIVPAGSAEAMLVLYYRSADS